MVRLFLAIVRSLFGGEDEGEGYDAVLIEDGRLTVFTRNQHAKPLRLVPIDEPEIDVEPQWDNPRIIGRVE